VDNSFSEYLFALRKDTPGKLWWNADPVHPATYRALRINPEDFAASYAVAPFRVARIDGQHVILAAHPAPRALDPVDHDWFGIETVIAWDPIADTAMILGDAAPQLVGRLTPDANTVFSSPRAFFQTWAIRRAQFAMSRRDAAEKRWHVTPTERDEVPGALLIGELGKVRLSPSTLPEHIETVGIDPKDLNRAIMRAARLPRVSAAPSQFRRAA
jgi:hypothetical protein